MNYAANVAGANASFGGVGCGLNAGWILVLFILLVLLTCSSFF